MKDINYESHHDKTTDLVLLLSNSNNVKSHFHRSFEILYIIDGSLEATIGNKTFIANKDDIVFVNKYYIHSYKVIGSYKKYVLIIPPFLCDDFDDIFKSKTLPPHLKNKSFNKKLLPILTNLYDNHNTASSLVKKGYINVIIGELIEQYKLVSINKNNNIEIIVKILNYIDQNYSKDLTLENMANEFGYSKYYFSKLFNTYIKENLNNYINMVRVRNVNNKLKENNSSNIATIAYECGFNSLPTFYRAYNKIYNSSPLHK